MARVKSGVTAKARHKKVLSKAKGYYGARSKLFKTAKQAVIKAGQYAYRDRRQRKRVFRALWITRINAAARLHGLSYSSNLLGRAQSHLNHILTKKKSKRKRQLGSTQQVAAADVKSVRRMLPYS